MPVLVFSHSIGTDHGMLASQAADLLPHFQILRYDTRGHGASDAPAGDYSIERLGKDLLAVMNATGVPRVDLCGVSIGGLTALWVAVNAPDRVRRVILANTAAQIGNLEMWSARINAARNEGMNAIADATMIRWFTPQFREAQPATVARFHSTIKHTKVDGYAGCCAAL